jgi:nucleoside transporter
MFTILKSRLGAMFFLEYFTWGAWYVTLGTWLSRTLHFSGTQVGWVAGTTALGAIIAPFFIGVVADRAAATQRVLAVLHGLGAVLLWLASSLESFGAMFGCVLAYSICFMPTLALTNSLCFRHIDNPQQEFGLLRAMGTLGWIVAGLAVGGSSLDATAIPMRIGAVASALLALYCLTLPHTPPLLTERAERRENAPLRALKVLNTRSMAIFAIASFLICIPLQFYYAFTNLFLNEMGVANAAAKMSGGQMSELLCMLLVPWFFRRLGVKYMLLAGMSAWCLRYVLFAAGDADGHMWMYWSGIVLHGVCFDFFFVVGQIYIDRKAPLELRAATQGLITLITYGLGMFVGAWFSGVVVDRFAHPGAQSHDWSAIWYSAAAFAAVVAVLFFLLFKDKDDSAPSRASA